MRSSAEARSFGKARRSAAAFALGAVLLVAAPQRATGLAVANLLTGISSEVTQLLNFASLVTQIVQLYQQAITIWNQLKTAYREIENLGSFNWSNPLRDLMELRRIVQTGAQISYAAANIEAQWEAKYKGYRNYVMNHLHGQSLVDKFADWSQTHHDNVIAVLEANGLQDQQFQDERDAVQTIEQSIEDTDGQNQTAKAAAQLAGVQVDQLQKLRNLIMLQTQLHAEFQDTQQDLKDAQDAADTVAFPADGTPPDDEDGEEY